MFNKVNNVSPEDLRSLRAWGRSYALFNNIGALYSAAEYYALAKDGEQFCVLDEFVEGVRNNVRDMIRYEFVMSAFWDRVRFYNLELNNA